MGTGSPGWGQPPWDRDKVCGMRTGLSRLVTGSQRGDKANGVRPRAKGWRDTLALTAPPPCPFPADAYGVNVKRKRGMPDVLEELSGTGGCWQGPPVKG